MPARSRDPRWARSMPERCLLARPSPQTGYRPRFTITPRLSAQIAKIDATRQSLSRQDQSALYRGLRTPMRAPRRRNIFTLEKVVAMANGEDFPIVTESREQEVLDFYALRYRRESQSGQRNWSPKEISALHEVVTAGEGMDQGRAGEYRCISVRLRSFVPPPPREVPQLMLRLLDWWNTTARGLSAVITSAILHYRISDIHPFSDGNGRFARALALWELYRNGYLDNLQSLNGHYWGRRQQYNAALRAVRRRREDLTGWLEYSAEGLKRELECNRSKLGRGTKKGRVQ
jgi:hypothetical protein